MRMSCNGCRILRKGCSDDCTIKPCLDWIKSPDSQANATLFLAKFYGRAGLINLIEAGPPHLRPAIFKSLLYEACGRIVDPVSGSVGLLWSGNWAHCQAAVDAVLRGSPITGNPSSSSSSITSVAPALHSRIPPLKTYDIRHVSRNTSAADKTINKTRFKRSATVHRPRVSSGMAFGGPIQEPWMTHRAVALAVESNNNNIFFDDESIFSVETVEGSPISIMKTTTPNLLGRAWTFNCQNDGNEEVGLELTLGLSTPANK